MKNFFIKYFFAFILILPGSVMNLTAQVSDTTLQGFSPFPFGAAVNVNILKSNAQYRALVVREFNSITAENAMKFAVLHPTQYSYSWKDADTLVNFAQLYNKRVHGHTLIWHNSLPAWVTNFVGDSTAWENMFRSHIQTVVLYYKNKVTSWDVVNEAFNDDGTFRNSVWLQHLGPNYIARAFQYAHAIDPAALLFYNDYGHEYSNAKLLAIQTLANSLIDAGVPIHGLGLQLHIHKNTSNNSISAAIDSMLATGLKVHIAELDVAMNPENNLSLTYDATIASQQFGKFKFISRLAKKIAPDKLFGITTWNVTDADSWIPAQYSRPDFPLPFNSSYQKKLAYQGLKDGVTQSWNFDITGVQNIAGTFVDLGGSGTLITTGFSGNPMGSDNDNSSVQNIGFNFQFNGTAYNQFVLNTNGYIKLGASAPTANNIFYPTATGNTGSVITASDIDLIYPYNHDLKSGTSTAQYRVEVLGAVGSRVCTIQFKNVADKIATQYANMEFQIKLYEGSNQIDFIYGTWIASATPNAQVTAAVGIKGINAVETINVAKGSSVPWTTAMSTANNFFFRTGNYPGTGPQFSSRNTFLPDPGRTFRFTAFSVLPVSILSFSGQQARENNVLQWATSSEINHKDFDVQRSLNGTNFINIGTVSAKDGNTVAVKQYSFTDRDVKGSGLFYYRLKQNDWSAASQLSPVIKINRKAESDFSVTAINPFTDKIALQLNTQKSEYIFISLINLKGQQLFQKKITVTPGFTNIILPVSKLSAGIYFLNVATLTGQQTIKLEHQ